MNKYFLGEKVIGNKILFWCFQIQNGKINQYETLNFLKNMVLVPLIDTLQIL